MGYLRFSKRLSLVAWVRLLSSFALFGTLLLTRSARHVLPFAPAFMLIVGNFIIFPSIFLSEGLTKGIVMAHVFPQGHALDANGVSFCLLVINSSVRVVAPFASRWYVDAYGDQGPRCECSSVNVLLHCFHPDLRTRNSSIC